MRKLFLTVSLGLRFRFPDAGVNALPMLGSVSPTPRI